MKISGGPQWRAWLLWLGARLCTHFGSGDEGNNALRAVTCSNYTFLNPYGTILHGVKLYSEDGLQATIRFST